MPRARHCSSAPHPTPIHLVLRYTVPLCQRHSVRKKNYLFIHNNNITIKSRVYPEDLSQLCPRVGHHPGVGLLALSGHQGYAGVEGAAANEICRMCQVSAGKYPLASVPDLWRHDGKADRQPGRGARGPVERHGRRDVAGDGHHHHGHGREKTGPELEFAGLFPTLFVPRSSSIMTKRGSDHFFFLFTTISTNRTMPTFITQVFRTILAKFWP